jgi:hypothetical protein
LGAAVVGLNPGNASLSIIVFSFGVFFDDYRFELFERARGLWRVISMGAASIFNSVVKSSIP